MRTVRDATYEVLRERGLTLMFSNPGSTEIDFLASKPADIDFLLGLHEGSVVGMATGAALASGQPALVLLHTTAGLGNAVGALATARENRAPLVVIIGQQDRRHLAAEPFLAGHLEGLAGDYPVSVTTPARPQDVPAAIDRAYHDAMTWRGPALVVVPMDDWAAEATDIRITPREVLRASRPEPAHVQRLADLIGGSSAPCLVAGAGADTPEAWAALQSLAELLGCPVFQEPFGARAGFPQDHPQFAGHLPAIRSGVREHLASFDLVVVVGTALLRQYPYGDGAFVTGDTTTAVVTADPAEAHRSAADLALVATVAATIEDLVTCLTQRGVPAAPAPVAVVPAAAEASPRELTPSGPLTARRALELLAMSIPSTTVLLEESPSSRPHLHAVVPARTNTGFLSAAMGGLGFAVPAAVGARIADPGRPAVAVVGDGASLYNIQALWSAQRYDVGVLLVIMNNGRYAIMDRLAESAGGEPAWPDFADIDFTGLARALGCEAVSLAGEKEWASFLDDTAPGLARRTTPLVAVLEVLPDAAYRP